MSPAPIGGIILAAGSSRRFGNDKRLVSLPDGRTLLQQSIKIALQSVPHLLIVLRHDDMPLQDELRRAFPAENLAFHLAPESDRGMAHSLASAIELVASWQAALVILADMPYIHRETFTSILAAFKPSIGSIIVPAFNGKRGHPVLFDQCYFREITMLRGDKGARSVIDKHSDKVTQLDVNDPGILIDIDTPIDIRS